MRENTKYNEIVGITAGGNLFILNEIFKYINEDGKIGLHGATRYEMGVITQAQIDAQNSDTGYFRDLWRECVARKLTEKGLEEWTQEQIANLGSEHLTISDDPSFRLETQEAYDKLPNSYKSVVNDIFGEKGKDFVEWDCVCCGRCGKDELNFQAVFRPDLLKLIQEAEKDEKTIDK